jgi:hypothetical protein
MQPRAPLHSCRCPCAQGQGFAPAWTGNPNHWPMNPCKRLKCRLSRIRRGPRLCARVSTCVDELLELHSPRGAATLSADGAHVQSSCKHALYNIKGRIHSLLYGQDEVHTVCSAEPERPPLPSVAWPRPLRRFCKHMREELSACCGCSCSCKVNGTRLARRAAAAAASACRCWAVL